MSFFKKRKEKHVPSFMMATKSSSKKTREKIINICLPRRFSAGPASDSFGDARLHHPQQEGVDRKPLPTSMSESSIPRYMRPTESSASKMQAEKYKLRAPSPCIEASRPKEKRKPCPPRIPPSALRRSASTPNGEIVRIQMSNVAMNSFVESLRSSTPYYDNAAKQVDKMRSSSRQRKMKECDVPRYQQGTVVSSLRQNSKRRS